jgi:transcriptional regulator with XRE-family HTH domain
VTIGEKIKHYRKNAGLTQNQLAKATNIHIVSIKKYETNKMQPQLPQIERIAAALNIGTNALVDIGNLSFGCKTIGDLAGIIIMFCNSHILEITGERNKNGTLNADSMQLHFCKDSELSKFLALSLMTEQKKLHTICYNDLYIQIKDTAVLSGIIKWEKLNHEYSLLQEQGVNTEELLDVQKAKEQLEFELKSSMVLLSTDQTGISVETPPDYSDFL